MSPVIAALVLLAVGIVWRRWRVYRRQIVWGAGLTVPVVIANIILAGSLQRIGETTGSALISLAALFIGLMSFGGLLAFVYELTVSRWLTSVRSERRHSLLWLLIGLIVSVTAAAFGTPIFLALVIGLLINAILAAIIDWRMFWDVVVGALGFAVWYFLADVVFGLRVSGDITPLLIGPQPIGITIAGLSPERLLAMAGLGSLIGPIFVAVKRYRLPEAATSSSITTWKLFLGVCTSVGLMVAAVWFTVSYLQAPRVLALTPTVGQTDVLTTTTVTLNFDHPVNRHSLQITLDPAVPGTWQFSNGDSERHAFRTATFSPEIPLVAGVTYIGKVKNIASLWGLPGNDQSVQFTTAAAVAVPIPAPIEPIVQPVPEPIPVPVIPDPVVNTNTAPVVVTPPPSTPVQAADRRVQLSVAMDYQDQPLSCEAAALKMALSAKGVNVSESAIMKIVGYDPTPHKGKVWGNPHVAFVGNIAGHQNTTGYGVYWEPIAKAGATWRTTRIITNGKLTDLTAALDSGDAVVIWGTLGNAYRDDWKTPDGTSIIAWKGEHARTLIGYVGTSANPTSFIINDPIVGRVTWSAAKLNANWGSFSRSAVVVE